MRHENEFIIFSERHTYTYGSKKITLASIGIQRRQDLALTYTSVSTGSEIYMYKG